MINYDFNTGQIKNSDGSLSDYYIKLDDDGMFVRDASGNLTITDADGNIKNPKYTSTEDDEQYYKFSYLTTDEIYSENNTNIEYKDIVKVY